MRNLFIGLLIVAAIVIGGTAIASVAYQAGLSTAITTAAANAPDGTVVTPVAPVPYGYPYGYGYWGWGWGHGFPLFGFFGFLLVIFIIFALLRAAFWRGRGWGGGWGPGGYGKWGGPGGQGRWGDPNQDPRNHVRQTFDEWHRESHGESGSTSQPTDTTQPPTPTRPNDQGSASS